MNTPTWIWYYGDFELHRHMLMSLEREERGGVIPTIWKVSDCSRSVRFTKFVDLLLPEEITVTIDGVGYMHVDGKPYNCKSKVPLEKGRHRIDIFAGNATGVPSVFVQGDSVISDESWSVTRFDGKEIGAGCWNFNDVNVPPSAFKLPCNEVRIASSEEINGGILCDFGRECYIKLKIFGAKVGSFIKLYYGESRAEALGGDDAIIADELAVTKDVHILPARGCRYVYLVSEYNVGEISGLFEYLPLSKKGRFISSNETLNKIHKTAEYTLRLNSRLFFTDGIKRDRWVWSGDAYQNYFENYYTYFDEGLFRRTQIALRGNDPVASHVNIIVDYSFYWIIAMENNLLYTGDEDFIHKNYDKMVSLMDFCMTRLNKDGLIEGLECDWTFIDWSDMEKHGALCAEQILYCTALGTMAKCAKIVGNSVQHDKYKKLQKEMKEKIIKLYWNKEKGAFVTTYHKGKPSCEVRRHANIFAILFDLATPDMIEKIKKNVLYNDNIPQITTPYFKFYELDVLCKTGDFEKVLGVIESYWGGMLNEGATTFWEIYDPAEKGDEHYDMYGSKFSRSLCHAWGATPLYLLGRYCLGVYPTKKGYKEFEVRPQFCGLKNVEGIVPIKNGNVYVKADGGFVTVVTDVDGGYFIRNGNRIKLKKDEVLTLPL